MTHYPARREQERYNPISMLLAPFPYRALLQETFVVARARIPTLIGTCPLTDLTWINDRALDAWERQWVPQLPAGKEWSDWDWRGVAASRSPKLRRRFDVAVWSDDHLCGLAYGVPSLRRQNLTIRALQGSPVANHPLRGKILAIVHELAAMYGTALGCQELRFSKPLPGMIPYYEGLGFKLARPQKGVIHCARPL
jgi:hypothetical protein